MAYVTTVPGATQRINETQAPIQNNFAAIKTAFDVNHTALDDTAAQGFHKFLTMPEQVVEPATDPHQGALYTAVGAVSGQTELCFRREDSVGVGGAIIPFTEGSASYTRLPSGLILRWGVNSWTGVQDAHTCTTAPYFTHVYAVYMSETNALGYGRFIYFVSATVVPATEVTLRAAGKNATGADIDVQAYYLIVGD